MVDGADRFVAAGAGRQGQGCKHKKDDTFHVSFIFSAAKLHKKTMPPRPAQAGCTKGVPCCMKSFFSAGV
jgi:hypothetical protein